MSDDDLWRPKDPAAADETQPITGPTSWQPPPPPAPTPTSEQPAQPSPPPSVQPSPGPGAVPPPHNPYAGGDPYTPPPNPYVPPQEFGTPQSPYGSPYQPAYAGGTVPDHPSATTAMVLGIIGLVGLVFCGGLTLLLSPAAWVVGAKAVREIDASPGRYGGRDRAQSGKIMGIIGSILLVLGVLAILAIVVLAVAVGTSDPTPVHQTPNFGNSGA